MTAAVVGDRCHDIEAARETGSLAIGALYGYGGDEPKEADITIKSFEELTSIFDRRLPIFEKMLGEIERKEDKNRPFVVGINGIDGAGKTEFADAFERFLKNHNYKTQSIHLDDFHNPRKIRYAGKDQADNYYNLSFNIKHIVEKLLKPLRRKGDYSAKMRLLDWHTDKYDIEKEFTFSPNTIVIFEGVFLFRKELAPYIDYKVFLDIAFEESKRRAKDRDPKTTLEKYDVKYLPAQQRYLGKYPSCDTADMVVDNSDWEKPKISYLRKEK